MTGEYCVDGVHTNAGGNSSWDQAQSPAGLLASLLSIIDLQIVARLGFRSEACAGDPPKIERSRASPSLCLIYSVPPPRLSRGERRPAAGPRRAFVPTASRSCAWVETSRQQLGPGDLLYSGRRGLLPESILGESILLGGLEPLEITLDNPGDSQRGFA